MVEQKCVGLLPMGVMGYFGRGNLFSRVFEMQSAAFLLVSDATEDWNFC